jgi:hypothetical protein
MIQDKHLQFSEAQAITAAAGSTNTYDQGVGRDLGTGEPLFIVLEVTTAFTDSGSNSTLTVALEGDSTESFTPDGTQDLITIPALAAVGDKFFVRLHPGMTPMNYRYLRLKYTPNNGDLTTGSLNASIVKDIQKWKAYANAYDIG